MGGGIIAVKFISRSHSPALAIAGRCALWCNFSAKAIATVIRSCLSLERSRRCRRLIAAPETRSAMGLPLGFGFEKTPQRKGTLGSNACCCCVLL